MRRTLAAALACVVLSANAQQQIQAPTRVSAFDFQCQDAAGNKLSDHQRIELAHVACLNNPAGAFIQGGRYRINRPSSPDPEPEPTPCPPQPADESRTAQCPAGSTGNFTQTRTYASVAAPTCWMAGEWSPSSPPAGACNAPPTLTGTPTAAIVAGQPYSFVPVAHDPDGDTLAFSIANRPNWATFTAATGALTGTPTTANVGISSSIVITVSDGKASAATPAFSITVTAPPATTLPAPGGISATTSPHATNDGNHNVALSWLTVAGATGYAIERCTGATCTDGFIALGTTTNTAYTNSNVPGGLTYRYRIRGTAGAVVGAWSALRTVTTPTSTAPPPPPPPATGTASLSWTAPTENTNGTALTNLAGYRIRYSTVGDAGPSLSQTIEVPNAAVTSYVVEQLTAGPWAFAVEAYTASGITSQLSNTVTKVVQ